MKKKLLLFVFALGIISIANAQVIELIGKGVVGETTTNLALTDINSIDHVDVGVIYKKSPGDLHPSPNAVTFNNSLNENPPASYTPLNFDYGTITGYPIGVYEATFNTSSANGVDAFLGVENLHSFYAFVHRNQSDSQTFKSYISSEVVFMYQNGSNNPIGPYVYNIPIETASSSRNVTIKIPVTELKDDARSIIIDITAGPITQHIEETTYSILGNSFLIVESTLENVPGNVNNISVSIYSPNPSILYPDGTREAVGDSFFISGVIADVDKEEEECGECEGKVTSLAMQYNGSTDATIKVTDKKGDELIFEGLVTAGGSFDLTGFDKHGTLGTEIILYVNGVQNTKIHTSCSQPIGPGLVSGAFEVLGGVSREGGILCPVDTPPNGGDCGECEGKVTWLEMQYNGNTDATIRVLGKKEGNEIFLGDVASGGTFNLEGFDKHLTLGTEIILYVDGVQNTKIHTSCSQPIGPGLISGDFEVLSGTSRNGGELCSVDVPPTPPNGGDCGECEGKATTLTLRYDGTVAAQITVTQKKNNVVVFDGIVNPDEEFTFVGTDKGTLGTEITIKVDGDVNTKIHTSCSVPLYIGLVSGDFTIVDGYSKKGGQLCETSNKTLKTASFDSCDGCGNVLTYPNPASDFVTIRFKPENSVNTKVILFNLYGQSIDVLYNNVVKRDRESEIKYNVEKLTNGLYFVKIINGSSTLTKKIIVSK